jgi:hypothetical protein
VVASILSPRRLVPKKEGNRGGRPRTHRTQITVRLDPDVLARLTLAGMLYRFVEVIAPGNYEGCGTGKGDRGPSARTYRRMDGKNIEAFN